MCPWVAFRVVALSMLRDSTSPSEGSTLADYSQVDSLGVRYKSVDF